MQIIYPPSSGGYAATFPQGKAFGRMVSAPTQFCNASCGRPPHRYRTAFLCGARRPRRAKPRYKVLSVLREERPPAGPFLNDQKGAKESVKEGDGVAASCASLASPFGELSSAPLRLLSHPHPLRWAADGSPASPLPTPIPLKRPNTGERGPKWSPAKRVHLGEEEQGSAPNFRRQAEIEGSGLCDDEKT